MSDSDLAAFLEWFGTRSENKKVWVLRPCDSLESFLLEEPSGPGPTCRSTEATDLHYVRLFNPKTRHPFEVAWRTGCECGGHAWVTDDPELVRLVHHTLADPINN